MFVEKYYKERQDGTIEETRLCSYKDLAKKSDVVEYYVKARAYTDSFDTRSKVAICVSIASVIISIASCVMHIFI